MNPAKILENIRLLFQDLEKAYGPERTLTLVVLVLIFIFYYVYSKNRKKQEYIRMLIDEKETTIQRIADEARAYKTIVFQELHGWTEEKINRLFGKQDQYK